MKVHATLIAASIMFASSVFAQETTLTAEQQQLLDETYKSAQSNPVQSIQNADGLTQEQKDQLMTTYQQSNADAPQACATILCIAGIMMGGSGGGACSSAIDAYFDIRRYRKGDFSPSRTAKARGSFLDKCPSSENKANASMINSAYGGVFASPF